MSLDASLNRLFHRNIHVIKLDLESMRAIMELLGNPHHSLICLHVAGTNGKGSVCAMLASIMRQQGYVTGLYTSPHLIKFNERIQVNGEMIQDAELQDLIEDVERAAAKLSERGIRDVTFFEFTTALAFLHFKKSGVQIAVVETGMGGRLDATNIITPALSVITSISLEHTVYLGNTIEQIAGEKAGIIKPGRPVIIGSMPNSAKEVIAARAAELQSPITFAEDSVSVTVRSMTLEKQALKISSEDTDYGTIHSKLMGRHQAVNAAITIAAVECLVRNVGVEVSSDAVKLGIAEAEWPGRCQVLSLEPPVILDGGHNAEAAEVLAVWIKKVGGKQPLGMVVGFLADKDPAAFIQAFGQMVKKVWIVPIHSDRAMPVDEIKRRIRTHAPVEYAANVHEAKDAATNWAVQEGGVVLITGSLYLAGEVLAEQKPA